MFYVIVFILILRKLLYAEKGYLLKLVKISQQEVKLDTF